MFCVFFVMIITTVLNQQIPADFELYRQCNHNDQAV